MTIQKNTQWDVVVIGGGPAGMIAAGSAAMRGKSVLLLEKNSTLGKKLLLSGGGRCNLTNNKQNIRTMAAQYKGSSQFLMSAFSQFDVAKTLEFFNFRGMETKEEAEGRVFPVSDKAQSVLDALVKYMKDGDVEIRANATVTGLSFDEKNERVAIKIKKGETLTAKSCIIATGGVSHPETGSTGEGFLWLEKMGHTIIKNDFALVPVAIKDEWVKKIAGVTLTDIKLTVLQDGKKQYVQKGKILFTHFGISGPMVLNMSKDIGDLLRYGKVIITLDLFPTLDHGALKQRFQDILTTESNKKLKNVLGSLVPTPLVPAILGITQIDGETACHSLRREDRKRIIDCIKAIPMDVKGLLGAEKAIVSSGGVDLHEINFKTMQSRIVPQIYIIGDALNINRPSGGYSLQLCWTTGFIAGQNA
ncbi:MAG: aminoacetone oxidase family FAD-binding enzyme [Patescibacteria group bacterium]